MITYPQLSPAELRALRAVGRHETNALAARATEISEQTLKNELSSAYRKLRVRTKTGAFRSLGWLNIPRG